MATFMPNSNSKWPFFFILKCGLNFSRSSWQWLVALMSSWTGVSNYRFLDFFFRAAVVYIILDHKSRCKVSQQHSKRDRGLNYRVCSHVFHLCVTFSYIWALNDNKYLGSSYLDFIQHLWFNNYSECSQFRSSLYTILNVTGKCSPRVNGLRMLNLLFLKNEKNRTDVALKNASSYKTCFVSGSGVLHDPWVSGCRSESSQTVSKQREDADRPRKPRQPAHSGRCRHLSAVACLPPALCSAHPPLSQGKKPQTDFITVHPVWCLWCFISH